MIKSVFETDILKKIMIALLSSIVLFAIYLQIDYSNLLNDNESVFSSVLYNRGTTIIDLPFSIVILIAGLMALAVMVIIPMRAKKTSQKLFMTTLMLIFLAVTYTAAIKTTESEGYLLSKKENFLNRISNFYSQYAETDGGKAITAYLANNDYKSISEMNKKDLRYTDILLMTSIVGQVNDPEIKRIYDESMRDGQINLLEKETLDTMILKKTSETL